MRDQTKKRLVPLTETIVEFETLLTSMRDVLHNMMGFTQLSSLEAGLPSADGVFQLGASSLRDLDVDSAALQGSHLCGGLER